MTMSIPEIVRSYNEAKDRFSQIGILADLNNCSREQIKVILKGQGITDIPEGKKKAKPLQETDQPQAQAKKPTVRKTRKTKHIPELDDKELNSLFTEGLKALDSRIAYYEQKLAKTKAQKEKLLQIKKLEE